MGRRKGRVTHWIKCEVEGCGAEISVWFDPKGVEGGSLGNGVMRMDVFKCLTGHVTNSSAYEGSTGGNSGWEKRVGPIEEMWTEKVNDIWARGGERQLELLESREA